jgi:hypothetical protein
VAPAQEASDLGRQKRLPFFEGRCDRPALALPTCGLRASALSTRPDADAAIEAAAKEFRQAPKRLIAVRRADHITSRATSTSPMRW